MPVVGPGCIAAAVAAIILLVIRDPCPFELLYERANSILKVTLRAGTAAELIVTKLWRRARTRMKPLLVLFRCCR